MRCVACKNVYDPWNYYISGATLIEFSHKDFCCRQELLMSNLESHFEAELSKHSWTIWKSIKHSHSSQCDLTGLHLTPITPSVHPVSWERMAPSLHHSSLSIWRRDSASAGKWDIRRKCDILDKLAEEIFQYTAYPQHHQKDFAAEALIKICLLLKELSATEYYGWMTSLKYKMANYQRKRRRPLDALKWLLMRWKINQEMNASQSKM